MTRIITTFLFIFSFGFVLPEHRLIPVENASHPDWHPESFWYYPWGNSGTHKGIDIFAKSGTNVIAPTGGFILYSGHIKKGGNIVLMLETPWENHRIYIILSKVFFLRFGRTNLINMPHGIDCFI